MLVLVLVLLVLPVLLVRLRRLLVMPFGVASCVAAAAAAPRAENAPAAVALSHGHLRRSAAGNRWHEAAKNDHQVAEHRRTVAHPWRGR